MTVTKIEIARARRNLAAIISAIARLEAEISAEKADVEREREEMREYSNTIYCGWGGTVDGLCKEVADLEAEAAQIEAFLRACA